MPALAPRTHRRSTSASFHKARPAKASTKAPRREFPLATPPPSKARKARPAPLVFPEVHSSPTPVSSRPASPNSPTFRVVGFKVPGSPQSPVERADDQPSERSVVRELLQPPTPTKTPTCPPTLDDWLAGPKAVAGPVAGKAPVGQGGAFTGSHRKSQCPLAAILSTEGDAVLGEGVWHRSLPHCSPDTSAEADWVEADA